MGKSSEQNIKTYIKDMVMVMKKIIIDGNKIHSQQELFDSIRQQLMTEDLIGNNLDALYDVLSQYGDSVETEICNPGDLREHLGEYADKLMQVLWDATSASG